MKLIINGVSVSVNKQLVKEIVFNGSEVTVINETKNFVNDEAPIINETSKEDVCVSEYTVDNPKLVKDFLSFEEWYMHDVRHRKDEPYDEPAIEYSNVGKVLYLNGKFYGLDDDATNES